jgi:hypothetical protein
LVAHKVASKSDHLQGVNRFADFRATTPLKRSVCMGFGERIDAFLAEQIRGQKPGFLGSE